MKTKLHLFLAAATVLGTAVVTAQDAPPRPPESPERPRRPDADRPPQDGQRRPDGERPRGPRDGERSKEQPSAPLRPTSYLGVVTSVVPSSLSTQLGMPEGFGLVVDDVLPDSPAKAGGIQRFDVLKTFGEQKLVNPSQLAALVRAEGKDKEVAITLLRKGAEEKLTVKVGEKMLPERETFEFKNGGAAGELERRLDQFRGQGDDRPKDLQRRFQEHMEQFQKDLRKYHEKIEQWQKDPKGAMPAPPNFQPPRFGEVEPGGPIPPNVLREMRPGGAPEVRTEQDGATTRWSTASARVAVKDESGEVVMSHENGHRVVTAKNAAGESIFTGPYDTEEQRRAVPENIRRRIEKLNVSAHAETSPPQPPASGPHPPAERSVQ